MPVFQFVASQSLKLTIPTPSTLLSSPSTRYGHTIVYLYLLSLRFIEYASIREADAAITQFNGFDVGGGGTKLVVKVQEKQEDRAKRLQHKKEEDEFFSTLHCGRRSNAQDDGGEEFEMDKSEAEKSQQNPLVPKYFSHPPGSASSHPTESSPPSQTSLSSSAGALSLSAQPGITDHRGLQASPKKQLSTGPMSSNDPAHGAGKKASAAVGPKRPCKVCGQLCTSRCRLCKTPYCGVTCQTGDWELHKDECKSIADTVEGRVGEGPNETGGAEVETVEGGSAVALGGGKCMPSPRRSDGPRSPSVSPQNPTNGTELKLAEDSEDEGFEVSLPDNLADVQKCLKGMKLPLESECLKGSERLNDNLDVVSGTRDEAVAGLLASKADQDRPKSLPPSDLLLNQEMTAPTISPAVSPCMPLLMSPSSFSLGGQPRQSRGSHFSGLEVPITDILSLFDRPTVPLSSFPLDAPLPSRFKCVVTSALSASKFSVVYASIEVKQLLNKIKDFGAVQSPELIDQRELTIGSKVGLRSKTVGGFFRAEVTFIRSGTIDVVLYDFGSHHVVSASDALIHLPEDLLTPPSLRHRCTLRGVCLPHTEEGAEFVIDLVRGKFVAIESDGYVRHSKVSPNVCYLICDSVTTVDGSLDIMKTVQESMATKRPSGASDVEASMKLHFSRDVPFHLPPGKGRFKVFPTVVTNPCLFWAQVVHQNSKNLFRMQDDLNTEYQNRKHITYVPTIGEMCVAKFSEDQKFYRVDVQCVNYNGTVDILYVDYGHSETVTTEQLWHLRPIFFSLPRQAVRMSLADIVPSEGSWSDNAIAHFRSKVTKREVEAEVTSLTEKEIFVKLFSPDYPNKTINDALVSQGLAARKVDQTCSSGTPTSPASPVMKGVSVSVESSRSMGRGRGKPFSSAREPKVEPGFRTSHNDPHSSPPKQLVQADANEHVECSPSHSPTVRDGSVSKPSPKRRTPPLNEASSSLSPRRRTPPLNEASFSLSPRKGTPSLNKASSSPSPRRRTPSLNEPSSSLSPRRRTPPLNEASSSLSPRRRTPSLNEASSSPSPRRRTPPLSEASSSSFKASKLSPWAPDRDGTVSKPNPSRRSFPVKGGFTRTSSGGAIRLRLALQPTQLNEGEEVQAMVTHVWDPSYFWVQTLDNQELRRVMQAINSAQLSPIHNPVSGMLCISRYAADQCLYRCQIETIEGSSALVMFVDYGNSEKVSLNEIFAMEANFKSLPAQVIVCTVNNILNPDGKCADWNQSNLDFFKSLVCGDNITVTLKCVKSFPMKNVVDVTVQTDSGPELVHDLMVESGHAFSAERKGVRKERELPREVRGGGRSGSFPKQVSTSASPSSPSPSLRGHLLKEALASPCGETIPHLPKSPLPSSTSTLISFNESTTSSGSVDHMEKPALSKATMLSLYPPSSELVSIEFPTSEDYFEAVVSEVRSPNSLFIQPGLSTQQSLSELLQSLNAHLNSSTSSPPSSPPQQGALCCAKFKDGLWYRAEVTALQQQTCSVRFVDYGNTETVALSDIVPCPQQFLATPRQAVECALNGVGPPKAGGTGSAAEASKLLKKLTSERLLLAKVVGEKGAGKKPLVELIDTSGSTDVNIMNELIASGHAVATTSVTSNPVSPSVLEVQEDLKPILYHPCSEVDSIEFPSSEDYFEAIVSEVRSPSSFFIQPGLSTQKSLSELLQSLNAHLNSSTSSPPSSPPQQGALCCAKFKDGLWYRAEVTALQQQTCSMRFVDYGNTETVALSDIVPCPQQFLAIPRQAVECALNGVGPPKAGGTGSAAEASKLLKKLTSERLLLAKVVGEKGAGKKPLVELVDTSGSTDVVIANELITSGHAVATTSVTSNPVSPSVLEVQEDLKPILYHPCSEVDSIEFPSSEDYFEAIVSEVRSPSSFFIQPGLSTQKSLSELLQSLNAHLNSSTSSPPSSPPQQGALCCAKFKDGLWYRAEVTALQPQTCSVRFVDYGNTETVALSDIIPCPQQFLNTPRQAVECALNGVGPPKTGGTGSAAEASKLLKKLCSERLLLAKVVGEKGAGKKPLVELIDTSGSTDVNIANELIACGHAVATTSVSCKPEKPVIIDVEEDSLYPPSSELVSIAFPAGKDYLEAVVSEVRSPNSLFIQPGLTIQQSLSELLHSLNAHLNSSTSSPPTSPPQQGALCCAKFKDGLWYRAEVTALQQQTCSVRFVDYGNTEMVALNDIVPCPQQFLATPRQAVECALNGVGPPKAGGTGSAAEASKLLKKLTSERLLLARVVGEKGAGKKPLVELIDTSGSTDVSITNELIASGHAVATTSVTSNPVVPLVLEVQEDLKPILYHPCSEVDSIEFPSSEDYFEAVVSEVRSPNSFFIQPGLSTQKSLSELLQSLNAHLNSSTSSPPSSPPQQGALCCAKFKDGLWYRAEVTALQPQTCSVRFVDYGNTETVALSDIVPCPQQFLATPRQAVECALNGVGPPKAGGAGSAAEASKLLKKLTSERLLLAKVVGEKGAGKKPLIELVDTSGCTDVNIANELIASGHAVAKISEAVIQQPLTPVPVLSSPSPSTSSVQPFPHSPIVSSVPDSCLPVDELFKASVPDVVDPNSFSLFELKRYKDFEAFMGKLQAAYADLSLCGSFVPSKGAFCCAKFAADNCWYRCKVLSLSGSSAHIQYIDFGNKETLPHDELYMLNAEFLSEPCMSVHCSLKDVVPNGGSGWPSDAIETFKGLVMGESGPVLFARMGKVEGDSGTVDVDLFFDENCNSSVSDALIAKQCASSVASLSSTRQATEASVLSTTASSALVRDSQTGFSPSSLASHTGTFPPSPPKPVGSNNLVNAGEPQKTSPKRATGTVCHDPPGIASPNFSSPSIPPSLSVSRPLATISSIAIPSYIGQFHVFGTHIVSLAEIYFQIVDTDTITSIVSMFKEVDEAGPSLPQYQQVPVTGEICAAKNSEGNWFRARVLQQVSQNLFRVLFIDFGDQEEVSISSLRHLPGQFLNIPSQSVKAGLFGIPLQERSATSDLKALFVNQQFTCRVVVQQPLLVALCDVSTGAPLGTTLADLGITVNTNSPSIPSVAIPLEGMSVVMVTDITGPDSFWVQVANADSIARLRELSQAINTHCLSTPLLTCSPVLGQLCCAEFSQDKTWYRARVIGSPQQGAIAVQFVDFGNTESVALSSLCQLPANMTSLPAQAVHCALLGFETSSTCPESELTKLKQLVEGRQLMSNYRGMSGFVTVVELVDTNGPDDVYLHKVIAN